MSEQRTIASQIYPHLPSGTPDVVVQRRERSGGVADAMYPHLKPPPSEPSVNRWRDAAASARAAWAEANARAWGRR
jgi:hypothetical protein